MPKRKRDCPKNSDPKRSKSKSGFFGVVKNSKGKKWTAQLVIKDCKKHLGSFDTAKEAALAYDRAAILRGVSLTSVNFPAEAPAGYTAKKQALHSNNTVGYRGVSKNGKKYRAKIMIATQQLTIGTYETAKDAAIAYDIVVLRNNKSKTILNFPGMVHNLDVEPIQNKYKRSKGVSKAMMEDSELLLGLVGM